MRSPRLFNGMQRMDIPRDHRLSGFPSAPFDDPRPERFRQDQHITRPRAPVQKHPFRMYVPSRRARISVRYPPRCAPLQKDAGLAICPPAERISLRMEIAQGMMEKQMIFIAETERLPWRRHRTGHLPGHLAEGVGIIHDGREEINGLDQARSSLSFTPRHIRIRDPRDQIRRLSAESFQCLMQSPDRLAAHPAPGTSPETKPYFFITAP